MDVSNKWAICAVFENEAGEFNYTYYEERLFDTYSEALDAINDEDGEMLSQASTLDCEIDEDLQGYWLDDLTPYEMER